MAQRAAQEGQTTKAINDLITASGGNPDDFDGEMVKELIETCLKLIRDGHDTGQLKLLNRALKDMRYAYRVFNKYQGTRKITIFGSARTPEQHPDYVAAREFSREIARHGWMSITGAGDGIMKAGHEGPRKEASFGLSIRLPFETTANAVIEGDPKLINFRYFFTRKLMFMSHADAVTVFPGGYGTHDELFETLTLVQTGKSNIVPIVLAEGAGGSYWAECDEYMRKNLLDLNMISAEDTGLYYIAEDVQSAVEHVLQFYRVYHSSRYVGRQLVMRLLTRLTEEQIDQLNSEFTALIESGRIKQCNALPSEHDHLELPRLAFHHNRRHIGILRMMIDRINGFGSALGQPVGTGRQTDTRGSG